MIKDVLIPAKIGSYQVLPVHVVGFQITPEYVSATQLYISGKSCTVQNYTCIPVISSEFMPSEDDIANAVQLAFESIGSYNEIYSAISSEQALAKALRLPFTQDSKIRMVLPYELEQFLPISTEQTVIDFITTPDQTQTHSHVFAAAVRSKYISDHLELCARAGISPDRIIIDGIALYLLHQSISTTPDSSYMLVHIDIDHSIVLAVNKGVVESMRTIPQGSMSISRELSEKLSVDARTAREMIINSKATDGEHGISITNAFKELLGTIKLTASSIINQQQITPEYVILSAAQIPTNFLVQTLSPLIGIKCQTFPPLESSFFKANANYLSEISSQGLISFATAWCAQKTEFNLRQKEFEKDKTKLINRQLGMAGLLIVLLTSLLFGHRWWQVRQLSAQVARAEKSMVELLQQTLQDKMPPLQKNVSITVNDARAQVLREEKQWFAFSSLARSSFLTYLLELTTIIDRQALGMTIDKITISEDMLTLKAKVRDSQALIALEEALRKSSLFDYQGQEQNTSFTMQIPFKQVSGVEQ
ncbi:hypothetical protein J120_00245 [candidate division TM6 bacterium JCVI TM6SC1]|uniref:GspL cytoplasmic actin-ATPase-like domain-containing protein n=1 Tax=candidate division TM6 bacterium JCVI TM6SC1 TaxID=1306947 RepID=A0A0D2JM24_9BACT|nr:hypothetical protein J120_00245 [candidate division TM6 bacterium JCVI TM6SC1]